MTSPGPRDDHPERDDRPVGTDAADAQVVSDPDDETTRPDVTIDLDAADPWGEAPVGDPDLEAPAEEGNASTGER